MAESDLQGNWFSFFFFFVILCRIKKIVWICVWIAFFPPHLISTARNINFQPFFFLTLISGVALKYNIILICCRNWINSFYFRWWHVLGVCTAHNDDEQQVANQGRYFFFFYSKLLLVNCELACKKVIFHNARRKFSACSKN